MKKHEHSWRLAFTGTEGGVIVASHYHCQDKECDEWKVEKGGESEASVNGGLGSLGKSGVPK